MKHLTKQQQEQVITQFLEFANSIRRRLAWSHEAASMLAQDKPNNALTRWAQGKQDAFAAVNGLLTTMENELKPLFPNGFNQQWTNELLTQHIPAPVADDTACQTMLHL